jgi:hypothetical protein
MEHIAHVGKVKNMQHFVRKLQGKRTLGRPRHRWEGNIKMRLEEHVVKVWTRFK